MFDRFQSQANVAAFDIGLNVFSEAWLIVLPAEKLSDFINIKMPY